MTRRFRYWHTVSKKMVGWKIARGYTMEMILNNPLIIPMEWSGLVDKNKKEIYQGDIVCMASGRFCEVVWKDGALGYVVHEEFHAFGGHNWLSEILTYIEVKGNVYENPELLMGTSE